MGKFNIIHEVHTQHKVIAITFDDGPNSIYTQQVLDIFQEVSGHATFYMIGEQMIKEPQIVENVTKLNHEIGNHTYTHPKLTQMNDDEVIAEIDLTNKLIEKLTGSKPTTFRPPYLDYNNETEKLIQRFGYKTIGALN